MVQLLALATALISSVAEVGAGKPTPSPPACVVATPSGFTQASTHGSWIDPTCPVSSTTGIDPCAMPSVVRRHGVSVECCSELCAADPACQGFQVFDP